MNTLARWATGRNIILLLVLFLLINLVIVPAFYPKFQTLDTLSSYTPKEAYQYISSYGDQGRRAYVVIEMTLDLVYPFVSALLFSLAILYTFKRGFPTHVWSHKLALIPFGVMLADYLENACVVTMLISYPHQLISVAAASNIFTVAKFVLSPFELIFIVGLLGWLVQSLRRRAMPKADIS
jgi:hypothetical protein